MKKILFPTDFSPASKLGLAYAAKLAKQEKATLLIVHVAARYVPIGNPEAQQVLMPIGDKAVAALENKLKKVVPPVKGVSVKHMLAWGDPIAELPKLAKTQRCEAIVMSSHGRTGVARFLMGSVAEAVALRAPCTVLLVRSPAKKR